MEVQYFEDDQGRQPAREFIDGLDPKMRAKVSGSCSFWKNMANGYRCHLPGISRMASSS